MRKGDLVRTSRGENPLNVPSVPAVRCSDDEPCEIPVHAVGIVVDTWPGWGYDMIINVGGQYFRTAGMFLELLSM